MKEIKLLHNPTAGDESHSKEKLVKRIENAGYRCRYSSTKKDGWEEIKDDTDLIVVAGGDGTVRKVVKAMLNRSAIEKSIPMTVLPLGTANNIAKTFGIGGKVKDIVESWEKAEVKPVDVGCIYDLEDATFFIESFGYGIFPYLMQVMKKQEEKFDSPEDELKGALKKLHEIILTYEPRFCKLEIDGTDHSGNYLMAEVMNTKSIGPNLQLAPMADPGDGELEVVLVPEQQKEKFAEYINHMLDGGEDNYQFHTMQGKDITISWDGNHVHIDDEVLKVEKNLNIRIHIKHGALKILQPKDNAL